MNSTPAAQKNFLKTIVDWKRQELNAAKQRFSLEALRRKAEDSEKPRDFFQGFSTGFACIAEIKKASPSRGLLTEDFQPQRIALEYERGGAAALSVLTDERFFGGSLEDLRSVRSSSSLPVLRKEFIIDEYQIYEARAFGADAILLIAEILSEIELRRFVSLAESLALATLIESHHMDGIEKALRSGAPIIGVNNRDLNTLTLDLETSFRLKSAIPENVIAISESGIKTSDDLRRLRDAGYRGALIGETLMTLRDREEGLRNLLAPLKSS